MGNRVVSDETVTSKIGSRNISKLILGTVQLGMPYGINNTTGQPSAALGLRFLKRHLIKASGLPTLLTATALLLNCLAHSTQPVKNLGL